MSIILLLSNIELALINLSSFLIFGFILCSLIKNLKYRIVLSVFLSLFFSLQIISFFFNRSFIGYQFYVHLNVRDSTSMLGLYKPQLLLLCLVFLFTTFLFVKSRFIYKYIISKTFFKYVNNKPLIISLLLIPIVLMSIKEGIFYKSFETFNIIKTSGEGFDKALKDIGFKEYSKPNQISATPGKNIVVLSLESLEKGFLGESFSHITPNLRRLKKDWNILPLNQNHGSEWTSGSLYTSFTGFPAYFGYDGNAIFKNSYNSNISSITTTLKKAGYDISYFIGDANFSGTKEMLFNFGVNSIYDKYSLGNKGNDKDIFNAAKDKLIEVQRSQKPFALFVSTSDTHFPDGIYDSDMEAFIPKQKTDYEFTIASLDYLINDFIEFLKTQNLLENTIVYIFPDHLKMGSSSIFNKDEERSLYFLSNSLKLKEYENEKLYQIDLPKLILQGAEIKHNQKFLTDIIKGDKPLFIKNNIKKITNTNVSGLTMIGSKPAKGRFKSVYYEDYKKDTLRFIAHAGGEIDGLKYTNSLEALNKSYENGFRLFELDFIKTSDDVYVAAHDWKHWAKITEYKGSLPVDLNTFLSQKIYKKFTPLSIKEINNWFTNHPDAILVTDKVNNPKDFIPKFTDKSRLMMELFDEKSVKQAVNMQILSAMPSQNIIDNLKGNKVEKLLNLGVKNIAISRNFIEGNEDFLVKLKDEGIKAYAFHLNFKKQFNESYVLKFEMDYIYGIYADNWSFKED